MGEERRPRPPVSAWTGRLDYDPPVCDGSLWIFGYGSLVWRPAFVHRRRVPAALSGYVRRFWQGSTDHRGVPERPGRVVTLLPTDHPSLMHQTGMNQAGMNQTGPGEAGPMSGGLDDACWGMAYEIGPDEAPTVLEALDHRERAGYERIEVELSLHVGAVPGTPSGAACEQTQRGLVYVAGPRNESYLGPASLSAIALQIASASGPSGANVEYVVELARSLRAMGAEDAHVFAVEEAVARASASRTT